MSRKTVAKTLAAAGLVAAGSAGAPGLAPLVITGEDFSATEIAGHPVEDMIVSVGPDGIESVILLAQSQGLSGEAIQEGARTGRTPATKGKKPNPNGSTICCGGGTDTLTGKSAVSDDLLQPPDSEEKLRTRSGKGTKLPCPDCSGTIIIDGAKDMLVTE